MSQQSQSCCVVWEYQDENGCWNGLEQHYSDILEDMHAKITAENRAHPEFLNLGNYLGVPTMASLCPTRKVLVTLSKSYEMEKVRCMEGSLPALGITWQWFDGTVGRWKLYNQSVSLTLETARLSNTPNCSVDLSLFPPAVPVTIDVNAMIQVNSLTNVRSHIKREQGEPYRLRNGFAIARLLPQGPADPTGVPGFSNPNAIGSQLFPMHKTFVFQNSASSVGLQNSANPGVLSHQGYSTSFLPTQRLPLGLFAPQPIQNLSGVDTQQFNSNPVLQMTPLDNLPGSAATRGRKRMAGASASNHPPPKYSAHDPSGSLSRTAPVNLNEIARTSSYPGGPVVMQQPNQIGALVPMPVGSNQLQLRALHRPLVGRRRAGTSHPSSAPSRTVQGCYRIENSSLSLTFESVWRLGVMFPVHDVPEEDCCICYNELREDSNYGQQDANQPAVVMLNGCKHFYHLECLKAMYESGTKDGSLQCPQCKTIYGVKRGNCPYGFMEIKTIMQSLPGFNGCSTIVISYHIKEGIQSPDHLNPGKKYTARGFPRSCYLPNNLEGKDILKLLVKAWKRRLTFTVGSSVTTGESDTVVWNEIHHKTEMENRHGHGYPDPTYFKNVREELRSQGVRVDDGDDDGEQEYVL